MADDAAGSPDDEVVDGVIVGSEDDGEADRLEALLRAAVARVRGVVAADVQRLRERQPGLAAEDLARLVVRRGTRRVAVASFATGFGGIATTAVNLPSVLVLQTGLVLAVADVYGHLDDPELVRDVVLVLGGDSAAAALRTFGVPASDDFSQRWVSSHVTRQTLKQVNGVVARKVLGVAGARSLSRVTRLVPVVGAGVASAFDRGYAQELGERAIAYYGGR